MEQSLGRICGKPTDYKICNDCSAINWYENEECQNCEKTNFMDMTQKSVDEIQKDIDDESIEFYDDETMVSI